MPKKPSTVLVMRNYQPLSSRRWYTLTVQSVRLQSRAGVRLDLSISDAPEQAGRRIVHRIAALLAPDSPLCRLLEDGFGIQLADNEPLDLATLAGRVFRARFNKPDGAGLQDIAAVQRIDPVGHGQSRGSGADNRQEVAHGLG